MDSALRKKDTGLEACSSKECTLPSPHEGMCDALPPVSITYVNWKNRRDVRRVCPTGEVQHAATEFHKVPQWLFEAIDCEDGKLKLYALMQVEVGRNSLEAAIVMRWAHG